MFAERRVLWAAVTSRAAFCVALVISELLVPDWDDGDATVARYEAPRGLRAFAQWDAARFLLIARDGYTDEQSHAFFPALPWASLGAFRCGAFYWTPISGARARHFRVGRSRSMFGPCGPQLIPKVPAFRRNYPSHNVLLQNLAPNGNTSITIPGDAGSQRRIVRDEGRSEPRLDGFSGEATNNAYPSLRSGQVGSGQARSGQVRAGHERSQQIRSG